MSTSKLQYFNGHDGGVLFNDAVSADTNLPAIATPHGPIWSVQFTWDGTLTATIGLQACNERDPENWVTMTSDHGFTGLITSPAGSPGSDLIDISCSGALWYRFVLTGVSGSGNLTVNVNIINGFKTP